MRSRSLPRWIRFLRVISRDHGGRRPRPIRFRPIIEGLELREVPAAINWIGGGFDNFCTGHRPTGSDPNAWSNPLNWAGNHVPGASDTAVIPDNFVIATCPNGDGTFRNVTAPFNRTPVVDVPVSIAGIHAGPGDLSGLTVNQNLTLTGASEWDSGSIGVAAAAAFTNATTATLRMANPAGISLSGTLTNQGTVQEAGGADLQLSNGTINNQAGALYDIQVNHGLSFNDSTPANFNNSGTLRKSAGTGIATFLATKLSNLGGTIDVEAGTFLWDGNNGVSTGGRFTVASGAVFDYGAGNIGNTFTGTYTGGGGGVFKQEAGAEIAISSAGAIFNFDPGFFQWIGGDITCATGATLTNAGTMTLAGPVPTTFQNEMRLDTAVLNNTGTIISAGAGPLVIRNATLNNQAMGLYDLRTDAGMSPFGNTSTTVNNRGTLRKSAGTGISSFITSFSNLGGTIDVQKGTLIPWNANGGVSTGGTFTVAAGATLQFSSSGLSNTFSGMYTGSGGGTVRLGVDAGAGPNLVVGSGGATFNFPGSLFKWDNSDITVASGATLTNAGTLTLATNDSKFLTGTLNNTGMIIQKDTGLLGIGGGTVNNQPNAFYDFQGDGAIVGNAFTGTFNNRGTLRKSGGTGTSSIDAAQGFHNLGTSATIDVRTGTLIPWDSGTSDATGGTFTVATGAVLELTGGNGSFGPWTGTFTGSGGGTVLFDRGGLTIGSGGATFNFPAGLFQITGGTLGTGSSGLTNTGAIGWSGGVIDVTGSALTNTATGTITLTPAANTSAILTGNGSLINHGHIIHSTPGSLNLVAPTTTLNNASDGTYELRADGTLLTGGSGTFTNAGLLTKTAGTGTSLVNSFLNNTEGTLDAEAGTLRLAVGGSTYTNGTYNTAAGAKLDLTGGTVVNVTGTLTGGTGGGQVLLSGGGLTAVGTGATLNFPATMFQWSGGALNGGTPGLTNAGFLTLTGPNGKSISGQVQNQGTITDAGIDTLALGAGTLTNLPGALYDMQSDAALTSSSGTFINQGTFQKSGGLSDSNLGSFFSNPGTLLVLSGRVVANFETTEVSGSMLTGGTWELFNGAKLQLNSNISLTTSNAIVVLDGTGVSFSNLAGLNTLGATGSLTIQDGAFTTTGTSFSNNGALTIDATSSFTVSANLTNFDPTSGTLTGGTYVIAGTLQFPNANIVTLAANLVLDGSGGLGQILDQNGNNVGLANLADIAASGVLTLQNGYVLTTGGDLINFGYLLLDATSQLNVSGNYTQDAAATLEIQLDGIGGTSGQVNVAGAANLNGTLTLTPVNGYVPSTGDSFAILTYGTRNGSDFANPPAGFNESFDDVNGILTVVAQ